MTDQRSPRIKRIAWNRLEVEGVDGHYHDAKLWPGGSRGWDWRETGTKHAPGIQPSDVEELLDHGVTIVVLARGLYERLQVCPETLQLLKERNVTVEVLPTEEAVVRYNTLSETESVGALIHTTC